MEDFVGGEDVHLREGAGLEQVVDGGALVSDSAVESDGAGRGVGAAIVAAFHRVGREAKQSLDFVGGHCLVGHERDDSSVGEGSRHSRMNE